MDVHGGVLVAGYSDAYSEVLFNSQSGLARALEAISDPQQQRCHCFSSRNSEILETAKWNSSLAREIASALTRTRGDASSTSLVVAVVARLARRL